MKKQTIKDVQLKPGTRVLLRADFNVPLDEHGAILDDYRIRKAIPTLKYLSEKGCKTTVIAHLGRPEGRVNPELSLRPVALELAALLSTPFDFVDDTVGEKAKAASDAVENGCFVLLENLRFDEREETGDETFAQLLARYGEIFVQDGFGVVHRSHSSTTEVNKLLPSVAGLLLEEEYEKITTSMENPKKPLLAVIGGAKISDKIEIINRFIDKADMVAIGGAMANTFLMAEGVQVGDSLVEKDSLDTARKIIDKARKKEKDTKFTFYLPEDGVVSTALSGKTLRVVDWGANSLANLMNYPKPPAQTGHNVDKEEKILDIGPLSSSYIAGMARSANTVVWNGTLGMTEVRPKVGNIGPFEHASYRLLRELDKKNAAHGQFSLVGGGDTASYVLSVKGIEYPDHISTGGGASLDLMSGHELPGVEALNDK